MKCLQGYIGRTVFLWTMLMMLLLLSIELFFSMVQEAKQLGVGDYDISTLFMVLALSIPGRIYQMFPFSALVGTLMGLSQLAAHSELVAMRASGMSIRQLLLMVLKTGAVLSILLGVLGEWGAPWCDRLGESMRAYALTEGKLVKTEDGIWLREGDNFIHIDRIVNDRELEGVRIYRWDSEDKLSEMIQAGWAFYDSDLGYWHLKKGQKMALEGMQKRPILIFDELIWQADFSPTVLKISTAESLEKLSMSELWQSIQFRKNNELSAQAYELSFWQKCLKPFSVILMMLLGIPFILGPLRQVSQGIRLLTGIFLGFGFYILNASLGPFMLLHHFAPWLGAVLPLVLCGGFGILCFNRFLDR